MELGWEDLKTGHSSGLDCRKLDNSKIMEVKNKYNTYAISDEKRHYFLHFQNTRINTSTVRVLETILSNPKPNDKNHETIVFDGVEDSKVERKRIVQISMTYDGIDYSKDIILC